MVDPRGIKSALVYLVGSGSFLGDIEDAIFLLIGEIILIQRFAFLDFVALLT